MARVRADIKINGIVQGVGFRPFVHRKAKEFSVFGTVRNTSSGASLSVEGEEEKLREFFREITENAPSLAVVEFADFALSDELVGFDSFEIEESRESGSRNTLISPDVAICSDCRRELFDKSDRRYKYPFINCTNCGPRFSIIKDVPYDRKNTTMSAFSMCASCESEYGNIEDRRYHAEPDCCASCGPKVMLYDGDGKLALCGDDAILSAREYIKDGKIVAVKGIGGIHLACRCDDEAATLRLRERKKRDEKPFAIMCRDLAAAREYAEISADEERHLLSSRSPIVLLKKKEKNALPWISENGYVGIMLPYTPLHLLLLDDGLSSVVMTSANLSDLPIIYKNEDALKKLSGIADAFLLNDREIHIRCDDSLLWVRNGREYFVRRSRGYAPFPINVRREVGEILACGAEQKASFAISKGSYVFPSQHIGDLKNLETLDSYENQISHFENIFDIKPRAIACDLHPDYMSSEYADARSGKEKLPLVRIQHHFAHMASCMADNGISDEKCIGIVWDGTGLGTDGKIWGAEMLVGDYSGFERMGTIHPIYLPGGDKATKEISRCAASVMYSSGISPSRLFDDGERIKAQIEAKLNCPVASSMGRLFDGASAIIGIKKAVSYEGQGAVLLEALADDDCDRVYSFNIYEENGTLVFDWRPMIRELCEDAFLGVEKGIMCASFMNTLVAYATQMCKKISEKTGIKTAVASGGSFQNLYVLERLKKSLFDMGISLLTHRCVSTNDEGISLGQLMIANEILKRGEL